MGDWWQLGTEGAWVRADWLSFGQLVFTVLGFGIAAYQLRRSANAAEASQKLLTRLGVRMLGNDLLVLLPQLQRMEDDLADAVKGGEPGAVEAQLTAYMRGASHVAELLRKQAEEGDATLVRALEQAVKAAASAKDELVGGTSKSPREVVSNATMKMTKASNQVSAAIARIQRRVEEE